MSKTEDKKAWRFCETPEVKCTMNYCDENGCQNRKRELVSDEPITPTKSTEEQARDILKSYLDNDEAMDAYIDSKTTYLSTEDVEIILNRFANSQPLNLDVKDDLKSRMSANNQYEAKIQQLTKERDEFKESSRFQYNHVLQVREQLQAEKKRVEELREVLKSVDYMLNFTQPIKKDGQFHNKIKQTIKQ